MSSSLFDDLDNILVVERMILTNHLRVVLDGRAPDEGALIVLNQLLMERHAKVSH